MTYTTQAQVADLPVPGASLHYKVRGSGPLLLLLQGGDGDADASDALAGHLASDYTVLSYDRRGLSRSPVSDPAAAIDITTHSEDASRLLTAVVTSDPALVFGASLGAVLGLDLISRHPGQVRLLVAHEPPATGLLPEPERSQATRDQEEVEELYRREGTAAAMRKFVAVAGIRFDDREPDVSIPRPGPERIANLEFFLTHDAPAVRRYRLDLAALHDAAAHIVPAAGADTQSFPRRCAQALAGELGRPLAEFPGGHSGFMLRPGAFAARLHEILASCQ
jgi:pimeloyl-ACP methyl ester carboxylesterase